MKNSVKTPGIEHTPGGALTFSGITPTIQPYAIEIRNPTLAARWVHYLGRHKYSRYCFSYAKRQELIESTRAAHSDTCPHGHSRGFCGDPACIPFNAGLG